VSYARRTESIEPFRVMQLLAEARQLEAQGRDIVHFEIGEPDFPTPQPIVDAGIAALQAGKHHYTPAVGLPALREAIAAHYQRETGQTLPSERVVIAPGSSGALLLALGVLLDAGDGLLLTDPGYPCNRNFARFLNVEVQSLAVDAANDFIPTSEQVRAAWQSNTRVLMLASPANPTGMVIPQAELKALHQTVRALGGHLLVDEIYRGLVYEENDSATAVALDESIWVINSFSKFYGMTGWRVGWVVAPRDAVDALDRLAQNLFLAASTPAQCAALAAFQPDTQAILEQRRLVFQQRRDFLLPELRSLGFEIAHTPQGAFYLYADASRFTDQSEAWCREVLEQAGVAITPGADFGSYHANTHVRFAYTVDAMRIDEGLKRLRGHLAAGS
jgi:aspartate/methionine/tyrosine aminotransferase